MKTQTILLSLTLAIALSACRRSTQQEGATSGHDARGIYTTSVTQSGKPAKWPMPLAMMKHIRDLEQDVLALESSAEKDHSTLAGKIDGHTSQLIANCTMDGEAHDALHDWLMPFLQLNKEYAAAADGNTQAAKFREIQDSLAKFHERFE